MPELIPQALSADELEAAIRAEPGHLTADDFPVVHHFAPGVYMRELTMPAGLVVLGKIHKTEHLNLITQGRVSFTAGDGTVHHVEAPYTFVSKPGIQKMLYVHEATTWLTVHPTMETDLTKLEAELIAPHENPLLTLIETVHALRGGSGEVA
jgi:hypothetical protein